MKTICSGNYAANVEMMRALKTALECASHKVRSQYLASMYLAGVHKYEKVLDNISTGEFREENGSNIHALNRGLEQRFLDEVRASKHGERIQKERWIVVEKDIFPTKEQEAIREKFLKEQETLHRQVQRQHAKRRRMQVERLLKKFDHIKDTEEILDPVP